MEQEDKEYFEREWVTNPIQIKKKRLINLRSYFKIIGLILILLIIIFLLISFSSAIFPGESQNISINVQYLENYTVSGNSSFIPIVIINSSLCSISIPTDYPVENFTIIFNGYKDVQVAEINSGNSGNNHCLTNYKCSNWSECKKNIQNRTCIKERSYCYAKQVDLQRNCVEISFPSKSSDYSVNITDPLIEDKPFIKEETVKEKILFYIEKYIGFFLVFLVIVFVILYYILDNNKNKEIKKENEIEEK